MSENERLFVTVFVISGIAILLTGIGAPLGWALGLAGLAGWLTWRVSGRGEGWEA